MEESTLNEVRDSLGGIGDVVHELPPLSTSDRSRLAYRAFDVWGIDYPPQCSLVKPDTPLGFADPPLPEDCCGDILMLLVQASGHRSSC
jgi:hypothetical protein